MQVNSTHPLLILSEIDNAYREKSGKTKAPVLSKNDTWSGIGFRIMKDELIIQNTCIDEIISADFQRNLSSMPGAKNWLLGLISLRGQPLPVIDLKQYFFNQKSQITEHSRLVVIKSEHHVYGLFLEHVYGLKQFPSPPSRSAEQEQKQKEKNISHIFSANVKDFIDNIFDDNGICRGHLSITRLTNNTDFANAAR